MFEPLITIGRALALALRRRRDVVLENLALRQQLMAIKRTTKRLHLQTRDRTVLDRRGSNLATLAHGIDPRAAGHRRAVASRFVLPPMDPTFETPIGRPAADRSTDPRPRPRDGDGKPVVGSTAHLASAASMDFFTVPTLTGFCSSSSCCRISGGASGMSTSRTIRRSPERLNKWSTRFPRTRRPVGCTEIATPSYGDVFHRRLAGLGISEIVSAPASPWQNPYVEHLIGSIRRHVIVLNETHLRRVLKAYSEYYHRSRTHLGLHRDAPDHRSVSEVPAGPIVAFREVGGLHHRYQPRAA
jgi:hypothetical protein